MRKAHDAQPSRFGTVPLTPELQEWTLGKGVLITSWKRFKGLEAHAVLTTEKSERPGDTARANANR